ncbi:M48 family metallopeptidase [Erythrobacter sp. JK5]|uniref:M48 family metallopeptidase n=1 Tax=Erythrobacter sp. JK5 TaxID=2829500 RepID=UPI001BA7F160|nr:SprT family zinc-dependent metalloprotease [Erythrobacter sp. JK5]QUL36739.1 M48 family metallopeptidase [Erythrobacter sp. JK5]
MIDWLKRGATDPEIELGGETLPIVLRRHPRAKRLTLRLAPDGNSVQITLPQWARSHEAIAFAHARAEWLNAQLAKIPRAAEPAPGGDVLYRGERLELIWDESAPRRPRHAGGTLMLGGQQSGFVARVRRWMEREALALFEADAGEYCAAAALDPVPVALSRAQKRWGSCSDKARIRINWRLVQAPDPVRRSVVAHEVAHLVHFDHSPDFHALLGDIYEGDVKVADRWLKQHGRSLYASFG